MKKIKLIFDIISVVIVVLAMISVLVAYIVLVFDVFINSMSDVYIMIGSFLVFIIFVRGFMLIQDVISSEKVEK